MKKVFIALLLCCSLLPLWAQTFQGRFQATNEDGVTLHYGILSREEPFNVALYTKELSMYDQYDTVRVPATVTWHDTTWNVTQINPLVFYECYSLRCVELPESITIIKEGAFVATGMVSFTMPNSVTEVEMWCFGDNEQLTDITLSNNLTTLPKEMLIICPRLRFLHVPEGVITIDTEAVYYCRILDSISLPSTLQQIKHEAFAYNTSLSAITVQALVPPAVEGDVFLNVDRESTVLHVPAGCSEAYRNAPVWGEFLNIQDDAVGIATTQPAALRWHAENNAVVIESAQPLPATLYDAMGREVLSTTLQGRQRLEVPHSGLYILRHGKKSTKIIVP